MVTGEHYRSVKSVRISHGLGQTGITRPMPRDEELPENVDLDSEGIPSLEGALPEKEITGDAPEGVCPPRDRPLSPLLRQDTLADRLRAATPARVRAAAHPPSPID